MCYYFGFLKKKKKNLGLLIKKNVDYLGYLNDRCFNHLLHPRLF